MRICNIYKGLLLSIAMCLSIVTSAHAGVCFLPDTNACDNVIDNDGAITCDISKGQYDSKGACEENTADMKTNYQVCEKENNCYIAKCMYATETECKSQTGVSGCVKKTCWVPDDGTDEYPYTDNNLEKCDVINAMGSRNGYYKISSVTSRGSQYDAKKLKCDFSKSDCDTISTGTIDGTVKSVYYIWNGTSNIKYGSVESMWNAMVGSNSCPTAYLTCNSDLTGSIAYYNSQAECEDAPGRSAGDCVKELVKPGNIYCWHYEGEPCPSPEFPCEENHPCGNNETAITSGTASTGTRCCKCICNQNSTDLENCFNWLPCQVSAVKAGLKAPNCEVMGYDLAANAVYGYDQAKYHCSACPLDGSKWACTPKFEVYDCRANGYTLSWDEMDMYSLNGYACYACPHDENLYKCDHTDDISIACPGYEIIDSFDRDLMANECDWVQCPLDKLLWKCQPKKKPVEEPKCPTGFDANQYHTCVHGPSTEYGYRVTYSDGTYDPNSYGVIKQGEPDACHDTKYLQQFVGYSYYGQCPKAVFADSTSLTYRCVKGQVNGKDCLSSYTVKYHAGGPEPCAYLHGAKQDTSCLSDESLAFNNGLK